MNPNDIARIVLALNKLRRAVRAAKQADQVLAQAKIKNPKE
jgi:hypothetical protein